MVFSWFRVETKRACGYIAARRRYGGSRETSWVATALRQAKSTSVFLVSGDETLFLLWPDNGKCHFRAVAMANEKQLENVA